MSRTLARTLAEGSTAVMRAITKNSARQLEEAVSSAPRGQREQMLLRVQVGTESISPLLWAIQRRRAALCGGHPHRSAEHPSRPSSLLLRYGGPLGPAPGHCAAAVQTSSLIDGALARRLNVEVQADQGRDAQGELLHQPYLGE